MITLAYLIQRLREMSLQNLSTDYFDDAGWVHQINISLVYFFNYMNSRGLWYYTNVYEDLTAANPNGDVVWNMQHTFGRIWQVVNATTQTKLIHNNINSNFNKDDIKNGFYVSGGNQITIETPTDNLKVWYQRMPRWYDYNNLNLEIDLPIQAIGCLEFIILWRIMPVHLEQGAQLANNYFSQAQIMMKEYADNIGYTNSMKGMYTADQFNNEQTMGTWGKVF